MRTQWLAYAVVAVLAAGVGVLVAGLPGDGGTDTVAIADTSTAATTTTPAPTTAAPTTAPTTAPPTTAPAPTTAVPTTALPTTLPPTTVPQLIDRAELIVVAANGANVGGTASRMVARLTELGYVDPLPRDGTIVEEFTVVYYAPGLEGEALRLAGELELLDQFIGPIETAPVVVELPEETQLLVYTGLDRA